MGLGASLIHIVVGCLILMALFYELDQFETWKHEKENKNEKGLEK